jgi:hypothetical protein
LYTGIKTDNFRNATFSEESPFTAASVPVALREKLPKDSSASRHGLLACSLQQTDDKTSGFETPEVAIGNPFPYETVAVKVTAIF